jgi:hypothetical protein
MIKRLSDGHGAESAFEVSGEILALINDCLNEVLHGFATPRLEAILGTSVERAEDLLDRVNQKATSGDPITVLGSELALIARCIRRTVSELGPEFSIRTGFQIDAANSYEEVISRVIA